MFQVYILYSRTFRKSYVGYSSNLEERLRSHNELATKGWTIRYRPWELVVSFEFETKKEAMEKEKYFKTGKGREEIAQILKERGFNR